MVHKGQHEVYKRALKWMQTNFARGNRFATCKIGNRLRKWTGGGSQQGREKKKAPTMADCLWKVYFWHHFWINPLESQIHPQTKPPWLSNLLQRHQISVIPERIPHCLFQHWWNNEQKDRHETSDYPPVLTAISYCFTIEDGRNWEG